MLRIASSVACVCVTSDSTMMHFSHRMRESLIRVGHRTRSRKIIRPQLDNLKPCSSNKVVNFAIEVAAPTDTFPRWSYPVLPDNYVGVAGATMFDNNEATAWL